VGEEDDMTLAAKAPDERRRRILAAAITVLRDRGFTGTRVADIAATAGTSPALVLYHFSSLADVLVAALESVEDDYYADVSSRDGDDPRDQLVHMAMLSAEGGPAFGDWQLWLEVWVRGLHDERIDTLRRASDERWRAEIARVIELGVQQGCFTTTDAAGATLRIASLQDGLAVQTVLAGSGLTPATMATQWLVGAAHELRVEPDDLLDRAAAWSAGERHDGD
jgi:AcrR family transcriptional regulator